MFEGLQKYIVEGATGLWLSSMIAVLIANYFETAMQMDGTVLNVTLGLLSFYGGIVIFNSIVNVVVEGLVDHDDNTINVDDLELDAKGVPGMQEVLDRITEVADEIMVVIEGMPSGPLQDSLMTLTDDISDQLKAVQYLSNNLSLKHRVSSKFKGSDNKQLDKLTSAIVQTATAIVTVQNVLEQMLIDVTILASSNQSSYDLDILKERLATVADYQAAFNELQTDEVDAAISELPANIKSKLGVDKELDLVVVESFKTLFDS